MSTTNDKIGFLVVNVKTANGALPIENAQVTVFNALPAEAKDPTTLSKTDVIYTLKSDISGKTEKVALKTKDKELSQTPSSSYPYSNYNIFVNADGYYDSEFINVPIFEGITSLQNVYLIPVSEFSVPTDDIPIADRRYIESMN